MAEPAMQAPARQWSRKSVAAVVVAFGLMATLAGAAGATYAFRARGLGHSDAEMSCPGGISRLGQVLDENASIFPGDPETEIEIGATVEADGFLVEKLTVATHTGTHIDAPGHFIEGGRTVDELTAEELVWPAYVIDVRDRMAAEGADFQLSVADIHAYQAEHGAISAGSMVILLTGFGDKFGTEAYHDPIPGFSGEAVDHLFVGHGVRALGTDNFGPDATIDEDFLATYTALLNDGVVIPGMRNVESLNITGDLVIASPVQLSEGSGTQVDPIACHRSRG